MGWEGREIVATVGTQGGGGPVLLDLQAPYTHFVGGRAPQGGGCLIYIHSKSPLYLNMIFMFFSSCFVSCNLLPNFDLGYYFLIFTQGNRRGGAGI